MREGGRGGRGMREGGRGWGEVRIHICVEGRREGDGREMGERWEREGGRETEG